MAYSRLPLIRTFEESRKKFELSRVKLYRKLSEAKGNENCFKLAGGSSYRVFELPGVDCILKLEHRPAAFVHSNAGRVYFLFWTMEENLLIVNLYFPLG